MPNLLGESESPVIRTASSPLRDLMMVVTYLMCHVDGGLFSLGCRQEKMMQTTLSKKGQGGDEVSSLLRGEDQRKSNLLLRSSCFVMIDRMSAKLGITRTCARTKEDACDECSQHVPKNQSRVTCQSDTTNGQWRRQWQKQQQRKQQ